MTDPVTLALVLAALALTTSAGCVVLQVRQAPPTSTRVIEECMDMRRLVDASEATSAALRREFRSLLEDVDHAMEQATSRLKRAR